MHKHDGYTTDGKQHSVSCHIASQGTSAATAAASNATIGGTAAVPNTAATQPAPAEVSTIPLEPARSGKGDEVAQTMHAVLFNAEQGSDGIWLALRCICSKN